MLIWVLVIVNLSGNQIFVNTFDTHKKCLDRIQIMQKSYQMECVETKVNE